MATDTTADLQALRQQLDKLTRLLKERSAVAEAARELLAKESPWPRKRREVEAELTTAEMDLKWIRHDLSGLADRVRLLEAEIGEMMAEEVEFKAAEAASAAKAAKAKRKTAKRAKPQGGVESDRAADARTEDPATAGA